MAAIVPAIAALIADEDERERQELEDEEDRLERERMENEGGQLDKSANR